VVPVGWIYNAARDAIEIGGIELERSKKFRDIARTGRAAIVVDDLESTDPWRPRGIEVRGRADAIALPTPLIRIHPERIVSWGLGAARSARTVPSRPAAADLHANLRYCVTLGQPPPAAAGLDLLAAVLAPPGRSQPEQAMWPSGEGAEHGPGLPRGFGQICVGGGKSIQHAASSSHPPRRPACGRGPDSSSRRAPERSQPRLSVDRPNAAGRHSAAGRASAVLALEHVEGPEFAGHPDRSLLAMLGMPSGKVRARDPGPEVLLGPPARHD
jgi:pyridoxamine 5'-phosphate oxidase family protein